MFRGVLYRFNKNQITHINYRFNCSQGLAKNPGAVACPITIKTIEATPTKKININTAAVAK